MKTISMRAVMLAFTALSGPAFAEPAGADLVEVMVVEDTGAAERVEAAALLRVLSQEAASAACHMALDVNPKEARALMVEAKGKFSLILDALQNGNPAMNIMGAETNRKTLKQIEDLRAMWSPVLEAAVTLVDEPQNADALKLIKAENEAVLEAASLLTSRIAGEYSNPAELMQADVMLLDFASRQAMLTQKIAKVACEVWAGNRSEDRLELLAKTAQTYDLTLQALLNGMPGVGIAKAPTPEIEAILSKATQDWKVIKPELDVVLAGGDVTQDIKESLFHHLNVAMYDMTKVEHMYVAFSKHESEDDTHSSLEGALID